MKVKLKNETKLEIVGALMALQKTPEKTNPKYNYAVLRNIDLLKADAEAVVKASETTMEDYEKERIELCKEHAEKKDGKPVMIDEGRKYKMIDLSAFNTALEQLKEKHKAAIDKNKAFLETENEADVFGIQFDSLPAMEIEIMGLIKPLIVGSPTE